MRNGKRPTPVAPAQTHSPLGKPGLTQHRCPLLPLLLLHIPSYKKLPSHPGEVSAGSASPQSTQQKWRSGQECPSPTSCKSFSAWQLRCEPPHQHPNTDCRNFLRFFQKQLGSVCPVSRAVGCQKHTDAIPLGFPRRLEVLTSSHTTQLLNAT